jgi:type I restriction enzyme M protein
MRIVPLTEIAENDYNLNISRYIDTSEPEPEVDLVAVKTALAKLETKEQEIDKKLVGFLKDLGI